jgi:hypothetical protein
MGTPTKKTVSIHFCGGCNPRIERLQIAEAVRRILAPNECAITYNNPDAEIAIYISGCTANCLLRYRPHAKPRVVIAGPTVDAIAIDENEVASLVVAKIRRYMTQSCCPQPD